jgi:hypothetical protein
MDGPRRGSPDALAVDITLLPGGCEDTQPWAGIDGAEGRYLCEICQDVMTDRVLAATESPSGIEMAACLHCQMRLPEHGHG